MKQYYDTVWVEGFKDNICEDSHAFGPSVLDVNTVTEISKGMYRERTTVSIDGPWKVRPGAEPKTSWWKR